MPGRALSLRLDLTELRAYDPTDNTLAPWDGDEPYILCSVARTGDSKAAEKRIEFKTSIDAGEWAVHHKWGEVESVPLVGPTSLAPGERVSAVISVMEKDSDGGINLLALLGDAALAVATGGLSVIEEVLVGAAWDRLFHQLDKGSDDVIGIVTFTLENVAGSLVKRMRTVRRFKHSDPTETRKRFSETHCTIRVVSKYSAGVAGVHYHAGFVVRDGVTLASIPWTASDSPAP